MGTAAGSTDIVVPPGFRFHPTEEEILEFYLKRKVSRLEFPVEVMGEIDLNQVEPWELQEKCRKGWRTEKEWYFFAHKDKKYPSGVRTNRATKEGFWKATGRDKCINNTVSKIGMRKTLVFYLGRAPSGDKTDWIMHEYRLPFSHHPNNSTPHEGEGWVVCRVFKKNVVGGGEEEESRRGKAMRVFDNTRLYSIITSDITGFTGHPRSTTLSVQEPTGYRRSPPPALDRRQPSMLKIPAGGDGGGWLKPSTAEGEEYENRREWTADNPRMDLLPTATGDRIDGGDVIAQQPFCTLSNKVDDFWSSYG